MKLEILMKLIALANNNPNDNEANLAARKACKAIIEHKFTITGGTGATTTPPKQPNTPPRRPNPGYRDPFWDFVDFDDLFGRRGRPGSNPFDEARKAQEAKERQEEQRRAERRKAEERQREQDRRDRERYSRGQWDEGTRQQYKPMSDELKERQQSWQYEYWVAGTGEFYNPLTRKHYAKMFQDQWLHETGTRHVSDTAAFRAGANYGRPGDNTSQKTYNRTGREEDEKYYQRRRERGFGFEDRKLRCKTCGNIFNTKFMGIPEMYECNDCTWTAYQRNKGDKAKQPESVCHMTGKKCNTPVTCAGMGCQFSKR